MNQTILYRLMLPQASLHCSTPNEINKKAARLLHPWLARALLSGRPLPLPLPVTAGFAASAEETPHGLLVTLGQPGAEELAPVARIGVATDKAGGAKLWRRLLRQAQTLVPEPPGAPWCLVVQDPAALARHPEIADWLGDLADSLARLWLERKRIGPDGPGAVGAILRRSPGMASVA